MATANPVPVLAKWERGVKAAAAAAAGKSASLPWTLLALVVVGVAPADVGAPAVLRVAAAELVSELCC